LYNKKIAAVGSQTAEELLKHGICADFVPGKFDGRYLAEELLQSGKISPEDKWLFSGQRTEPRPL